MGPETPEAEDGLVIEAMPNDMFRVELESGHKMVAHIAPAMRMAFTRIVPGERVRVEVSSFDLTRGRIVHRYS